MCYLDIALSLDSVVLHPMEQWRQYLCRFLYTYDFMPISSFGQVVLEEIFFLEIDQPETTIAYGGYVC